MRPAKLLKRYDVVIALVLMLVSALVAVRSYAILRQSNRDKQSVIRSIPNRSAHFKILSAGTCIGEFQHDLLSSAGGIQIIGKGTLRLTLGADAIVAEFDLNAGFNSLGQLGGAVFRMFVNGTELRLGTRGIDPIRFLVRYKEENSDTQRYEMSGPGPIMLKPNNSKSFRLEYLHLGQALSEYKSFSQAPMLQSLALALEEGHDATCSDAKGTALDLSPMLMLLPRAP